jgi:hypothetical protein
MVKYFLRGLFKMPIKRYEIKGERDIGDGYKLDHQRLDFFYNRFLPKYSQGRVSFPDEGDKESSYDLDGAVVSLKNYFKKGYIAIIAKDGDAGKTKSKLEKELGIELEEMAEDNAEKSQYVLMDDSPYGSSLLASY